MNAVTEHWKDFLLGHEFTVVTDHVALKWLMTCPTREPCGKFGPLLEPSPQFCTTTPCAHLRCEPEVCLKRIQERSRPGEESVSLDYLAPTL